MQMVDTSNTAYDWHQLAIHKLADWIKLCFNFVFFPLSCVTKNEIFAQTLLHKVKLLNEMGVVGKFYIQLMS